MLFDRRKALPQVNKDLLDAADYIREHGWCQNMCQDKEGRVCLVGAVFYSDVSLHRQDCMMGRIDRVLSYPTQWNDEPGRTKEEVIELLEKLAWE